MDNFRSVHMPNLPNAFSGKNITALISVIIAVLSIAGLVYITKFSFHGQEMPDNKVLVDDVSSTQLKYTRFVVILLWLQIIVSVMSSLHLWDMFRD